MGIRLHKKPELVNPLMFCGWPGIGNIGILAVDTLRSMLRAEEFGEIEPWDFFAPRKVIIQDGLLLDLEFPKNTFFFKRTGKRDVVLFIGEEQPAEEKTMYAQGEKAYRMAQFVVDVATKYNCQRIYTSGAAVTKVHHTFKPKVWAVPNNEKLLDEVKGYKNTICVSEIEGSDGQGSISGLNGLLLGVAREREMDAICLMGEIPYYLHGSPWSYPKASQSVLEVFGEILGMTIDESHFAELAQQTENYIEEFLENFYQAETIPLEVRSKLRDEIEKLRHSRPTKPEPTSEEVTELILERINELFKKEKRGDERPH
jgi:hypothetical protein